MRTRTLARSLVAAVAAATLCAGTGSAAAAVAEAANTQAAESVTVDGNSNGARFIGVGGLSAGASSRLLYDYPEPERSQILDYLFKPGYGAAMQILKVEVGGDENSTSGSEASHEWTPGHVQCDRGYEWWLMEQAKKRNPNIKLYALAWGAPGWTAADDGTPDGGFFSNKTIQYYLDWLGCAKQRGLTIDYIGGWNERGYDKTWYENFDKALAKQYPQVKLVADDSFNWVRLSCRERRGGRPSCSWRIA
jgi:O-glycosyl hydrolase